ncbi:MAG: arsenosugar biosynthesis radical SAM protein ArsS [Myxococcales bacterium]|nr:arsenosugar biosynthesis radical SAM protein ArsS [Myxococcales bacterium]
MSILERFGVHRTPETKTKPPVTTPSTQDTSSRGGKLESLARRSSPLASPAKQLERLAELSLEGLPFDGDFDKAVAQAGHTPLLPAKLEIFQINIGKLCNMTCRHCHVDAGPDRVKENMDREMIDACLEALRKTDAHTVDITGGAPELNPHFRYLVDECVKMGKHVIDRCNLTILQTERCADLPVWLAERGVEIVCSLPHYRKRNTDAQRGEGTYTRSLEALRKLNDAGYGQGDPKRILTMMVNPVGAYISGNQAAMEREWKEALRRNHDLSFDRLIALTNMPISRYLEWLEERGQLYEYMETLIRAFNPGTVAGVMCRNTISIGWDGQLYDCDFNQMLALPCEVPDGSAMDIRNFDPQSLQQRRIVTHRHCFGCTAGAGSSCGGALE